MKKLLMLTLILVLAMATCFTSCDNASLGNGGGKETTADASGTDTSSVGETVTDDGGNTVTDTPELETKIVTDVEIVTDENGEAVTNEAGEVVTEIVIEIVTVAPTAGKEPDGGTPEPDAPEPDAPVTTPASKTPYAWYDAAYRTVGALTNGTLTFKMIAVSGTYSDEMNATVKLNGGNYYVLENNATAPMLYVNGSYYDVAQKRTAEIAAETFCDEHFPYYPLTNGMIPLTEALLDGVAFEEANGEVTFSVTLTKEDFNALTGAPSETMKNMVCTVVFDANGTFKSAEYAASFEFVDEKTGEKHVSSSVLSLVLSDLGTTAPITAPEDAAEYERINVEENVTPTVNAPMDEENKNPDGIPDVTNAVIGEEGKLPDYEEPSDETVVDLYEEEMKHGKDLNGDGVIGVPETSVH